MNHADFLTEWDDLKTRLDRLERFPQPPTIVNSNVAGIAPKTMFVTGRL